MILFASGRTDILTYYPKWFINRIKEGYIDTRNPFNRKLVSRIYFDNVDIVLFCSKNPLPALQYLDELDASLPNVPLIFHITITPYNEDIEPITGKIKKEIINALKTLSKRYGKEQIFLRYDPVLLNERYTLNYHIKAFSKLIDELNGHIGNIVISFIDEYKNVRNNARYLKLKEITNEDIDNLGYHFGKISKVNNINIFTCGEERSLKEYGFIKGACISKEYALRLLKTINKEVKFKKQTARKNMPCDCVQMVDIGEYNSCLSRCRYCYANFDESKIDYSYKNHDDNSSLLVGQIEPDDIIKERKLYYLV